jgi:hypothetical protein
MIELDLPADAAELHGVRLLQHGRRRVQHLEELGEPRRLEEQAVDEAHRLVETADQLAREAHEGDDLADGGPLMQMQPSTEREDRDQRDGRGRPESTVTSAHQFRTGNCAAISWSIKARSLRVSAASRRKLWITRTLPSASPTCSASAER